nr:uncharacterized protein LOC129447768 [Misgurnus anguillicaudatus]
MVVTPKDELLTKTPEKSLKGEHLTAVEACTSQMETTVDVIQCADTKGKKVLRNLGPCWHGKNPSEMLPSLRLYRTQQVPKGSTLTSILHPQHWLSSDEMDFASYLLAKEYSGIDGFQSTLLFSVLDKGGIVGTPTRQFVQFLHAGGNHWVTASNLFADKNEVCLYDSLSTVMDNNAEQALSWLLRPKEDQFVVKFPAVQQQTNSSNCGLLAIGFAYALCRNIRPENCQFREGRMRAELIKSFRTGRIEFKMEAKLQEAKLQKQNTVSVHCVCRTAHNKEIMVQCSLCHGWFHPTCLNIPSTAIFGDDDWHCHNCKV